MFCWLRFKFVFYQISWPFSLAPFLRNKPFRNSFQKKGHPIWKWQTIPMSDGSQRRRLACALLNSNNCSSSNYCSNSNQYLFELVAIATVSKQNRKNGKGRCQNSISRDLTRPGQRPGELEQKMSVHGFSQIFKTLDVHIYKHETFITVSHNFLILLEVFL